MLLFTSVLALLCICLVGVCHAEITWDGQHYTCFSAFQRHSDADAGYFTPVHVRLESGCIVNSDSALQRVQHNATNDGSVAIIVWKEAAAAGCFSFAQIVEHLQNSTETGNADFHAVMFGSAVTNNDAYFGSPIVEPYGSLKAVESGGLPVLLAAASSVELLAKALDISNSTQHATLYLRREPGPWNNLISSAGFKTYRYLFLAISIMLILYTFWEIGLMLCTLTVWNRRMLMYLSAIGYLVIFTLLQPYSMNSRAAEMIIYVSWIAGYISLTLFIVAWGTTVQNIHAQSKLSVKYHRVIHYSSAAIVSLTILVKLWAFAAESYQFSTIANYAVSYEFLVVFGTQTTLLGLLIWSFLYRTFGIAISTHTKLVLRNVAILCVVSLVGCLCMVALDIIIVSPAKYTVGGYEAIIILYDLGQCLLFISIFGALWVRDHAKRTRPLFHQHEFLAETRTQPLQPMALDTDPMNNSSAITNDDNTQGREFATIAACQYNRHNSSVILASREIRIWDHQR